MFTCSIQRTYSFVSMQKQNKLFQQFFNAQRAAKIFIIWCSTFLNFSHTALNLTTVFAMTNTAETINGVYQNMSEDRKWNVLLLLVNFWCNRQMLLTKLIEKWMSNHKLCIKRLRKKVLCKHTNVNCPSTKTIPWEFCEDTISTFSEEV